MTASATDWTVLGAPATGPLAPHRKYVFGGLLVAKLTEVTTPFSLSSFLKMEFAVRSAIGHRKDAPG